MLNKKHALALAAAGAVAFGATSLSAAPVLSNATAIHNAASDGVTQVRFKRHRTHARVIGQQSQNIGPFGAPFAAAAGVGAATGAVLGGAAATTGAFVGHPYAYSPYGAYAYAPGPDYGAYGYAPGGLSTDIGHRYYNGAAAPASQDNCAVDGGYGRLDYAVGC